MDVCSGGVYLEQMVSFPRAESAHKLYERRRVWMVHTTIQVHTHLVHSVNELQLEGVQQFFLVHTILMAEHGHSENTTETNTMNE